jgi:hypothetical protein
MSKSVEGLSELLEGCGLEVTFSPNCVSGCVGRESCRCHRCRGVAFEDEEPGWPRMAELITEGGRAEMMRQLRGVEAARLSADRSCPDCGEDNSSRFSSWRWTGEAWEHKCPKQDPQHGHDQPLEDRTP